MTTMLRSAAMTLLSKTLLTFLYKYLSDVDVEGVEMPSLYGSAEGPGSGWGVRLSNVKLREGAELMVLPGGRKAKEKAKPPGTKEPPGGNSSSTASSKNNDTNNDDKKMKNEKKTGKPISVSETATKDRKYQEQSGGKSDKDAPSVATDLRRREAAKGKQNTQISSVHTSSTGIAEETLKTEDPDSECESLASLPEIESSRPETPTQESSISFLSCFGPGNEQANNKGTKVSDGRVAEQSEQDANASSQTPSQEEHEDESHQYAKETNGVAINGHSTSHSTMDKQVLRDAIQEQVPYIPDFLDKEDHYQDEEKEGEDLGEPEEEDPQSPPMALRIGKGGYIGILDVRLVGRELHVLVEDAFLTLEAYTKNPATEEPVAPKDAADTENTTTDAFPGEATEKKPTAANPPAPVDISELKTTGERVLAMNGMARIFSSIPHLFLRDVVVRLVVQGENYEEPSTSQEDPENDGTTDLDSAEVVFDIGIGLLSVTEGDDFLSPFNDDDEEDGVTNNMPEAPSSSAMPENEYLTRRIRTGKGVEGGLWLNIFIPKYENATNHLFHTPRHETVSHNMEHRWARHEWLESTRNCVLRLSGLDIQARIFLGTKKELAQANSSYLWYNDDMSTYQGIDHTLYGFDHVVPGPTPHTLPPLAPAALFSASRSMDEGDDNGNLRSQVYKTDRNGVQSSYIESCFHRVARGMAPTRCTLEHLPCENCRKCWEPSGNRTGETVDEIHILDSYTPMPGIVLSVSFRDPLEMNVDRISLDGLGLVIGLFKKEADSSEPATGEADADSEAEAAEDTPPVAEVVAEPEASRGYFSSFFFGTAETEEAESDSGRFSGLRSPRKRKAKPPAFPSYMKPENITILGVFVAKLRLRLHVMREDDKHRHNAGHSFCYWDLKGDCLTLDQQKLSCDQKALHDMRLDIGLLEIQEFKGTIKKILVSAGVPFPTGENDYISLEQLGSRGRGSRPPWPTIASAMLDVPATLESMVYENRERHGVQVRLLQVTDQPEKASEKIRTLINCQLGALELNLPFKVGGVYQEIKSEAMKSLGFKKAEDPEADETQKDKVTQYRAQLGGGRVRLNPSIDVRLPLTRLAGNICPDSGFSIETLLDRVELSYGESSKKLVPTANTARGVSLKRFPGLPEHIRLRILLFLDDLEPLEQALDVRTQSNSFLRCNAVNKGLGRLATKRTKKKTTEPTPKKLNRRQELMNRLLTLDDDALDSLWASHQRKQRKLTKKTSTSRKAA